MVLLTVSPPHAACGLAMNEISLSALFVSAFLAATLLPGGSEIVFLALLKGGYATLEPALLVGTAGNTLGGLTSYALGRFVPEGKPVRGARFVRRYGSITLLLAWVPVIGDALCVAAGWMRLNVWWVTLFMAIGKAARYWVLARLVL
jgi:membrane protein YqaA with SNARE-associated domain